jgi:hypothetical protein
MDPMYGPSPMRKVDRSDVRVVRLRACIRPLDETQCASGHDGKPRVLSLSKIAASRALLP